MKNLSMPSYRPKVGNVIYIATCKNEEVSDKYFVVVQSADCGRNVLLTMQELTVNGRCDTNSNDLTLLDHDYYGDEDIFYEKLEDFANPYDMVELFDQMIKVNDRLKQEDIEQGFRDLEDVKSLSSIRCAYTRARKHYLAKISA